MTTIIAMATCGNFTNMGVSSMPFIMDVLFKPFGGKTTAGRSCVPVVFTYLLNLLRNTTDGEVVGKRTGDYRHNPARYDDIAHKHRRSQHYLLAILNSNMQKVDETLHKWCLNTLFSFMQFYARFVTASAESSGTNGVPDVHMKGVPRVLKKKVLFTDKNVIFLTNTMFDYLFKNFIRAETYHRHHDFALKIRCHEKNNEKRNPKRIHVLENEIKSYYEDRRRGMC